MVDGASTFPMAGKQGKPTTSRWKRARALLGRFFTWLETDEGFTILRRKVVQGFALLGYAAVVTFMNNALHWFEAHGLHGFELTIVTVVFWGFTLAGAVYLFVMMFGHWIKRDDDEDTGKGKKHDPNVPGGAAQNRKKVMADPHRSR